MFEEYDVRWFQDSDVDDYLRGLNETLYDRFDESRFRWKFLDSHYGLGFLSIVVVEEKKTGRPVGFNAFLPLEMRYRDDVFYAVQGCDGYVEPQHRKRGLFTETIDFMSRELAGRGPRILIGFNFEGSKVAAKRAGSVSVCEINKWDLEPSSFRERKTHPSSVSLSEIDVYEASDLYLKWVKVCDLIHVHRRVEYMKWRFDDSPLKEYAYYKVSLDGRDIGYIIVGKVENEEGHLVIGIDDYILSDRSCFPSVVNELVRLHSDVRGIELLTRAESDVDRALTILDVEPMPRYTMILKGIHDGGEGERIQIGKLDPLREDLWHITTSDIY